MAYLCPRPIPTVHPPDLRQVALYFMWLAVPPPAPMCSSPPDPHLIAGGIVLHVDGNGAARLGAAADAVELEAHQSFHQCCAGWECGRLVWEAGESFYTGSPSEPPSMLRPRCLLVTGTAYRIFGAHLTSHLSGGPRRGLRGHRKACQTPACRGAEYCHLAELNLETGSLCHH